jgi:hypothetical protein
MFAKAKYPDQTWQIPVAQMLKTVNEVHKLRERAMPFLNRLQAKPQVVGLGLLGGLASEGIRHFADRFSDIDITVLLSCDLPEELLALPMPDAIARAQPLLPGWLPNFKFVDLPSGIEFNVHQHILECESRPSVVWDNDKCSAYADTLEIVYDPSGHLRALVADKTSGRDQRAFEAAVKLLSRSHSLASDGVTASLGRGRPDIARDIITRVAYEAIDVLLFLSGTWPPGAKWRLLAVETLLDRALFLPRWSYGRIMRLVRDEASTSIVCKHLQEELLALLDSIGVQAADTCPTWPADVYGYATTRVFTDKQLRSETAADRLAGRGFEYALRILDAEWNRVNHDLEETTRGA